MDGSITATASNTVPAGSQSVLDTVCSLLAPFNRHLVELTRDTKIAEEMDVDSVAIFDVIMDVEDSYEITFPMEAIADIKTIGDLTDMISNLHSA